MGGRTRRTWVYLWAGELPEGTPEVGVDEEAVRLNEDVLDGEEDEEDGRGPDGGQRRAPGEGPLEVRPGEPPQEGGDSTSSDIHDKETSNVSAFPADRWTRIDALAPSFAENTGNKAPFIYS